MKLEPYKTHVWCILFLELKFIFNSLFNLHKSTHYWIIDLNYYSITMRLKDEVNFNGLALADNNQLRKQD